MGWCGFQLGDAGRLFDQAQRLSIAALLDLADEARRTFFLSAWGENGSRTVHIAERDELISIPT
jgi:hypothetical protein